MTRPRAAIDAALDEFLFGSERGAVSGLSPCLREAQGGVYFHCRRALRERAVVDHFVPWARHPVDLGHNLVLAHATCNGSKSDLIAPERHLESWVRLHEQQHEVVRQGLSDVGIAFDQEASRQVAARAHGHVSGSRRRILSG